MNIYNLINKIFWDKVCIFSKVDPELFPPKKLSKTLYKFITHDDHVYNYRFVEKQQYSPDVSVHTYILQSQKWPLKEYSDIPSSIWEHKLNFYLPNKILFNRALLYVSGGGNRDRDGNKVFTAPKDNLKFAKIALHNNAVVIELQQSLNQPLLMNNHYKKEDEILAYSYKKVMEDPILNAYLAGHLPMAKSIIKAMDAAETILEYHNISILDFVVAGLSKRGWATWLAALEDERVSAIIPGVIDILNVQQSIAHICNSYQEGCPPALNKYRNEGITELIDSQEFFKLMQIEDPLAYLSNEYDKKYHKRLSIPKYIITSSGDDFFVPDCSKFYFKDLPGKENYIRALPNSMHYLTGHRIIDSLGNLEKVNDAIDNFFYLQLHNSTLPIIDSVYNEIGIQITTSIPPKVVKLWHTHNPDSRDFRCIASYDAFAMYIKTMLSFFTADLCDHSYIEEVINFSCPHTQDECQFTVALAKIQKGWQSSFVELTYDLDGIEFILTTEPTILPDIYTDIV